MVMFALQAAVAHRHDIGARDFFSGKHARQQGIESSKRIMEHAAGQAP